MSWRTVMGGSVKQERSRLIAAYAQTEAGVAYEEK